MSSERTTSELPHLLLTLVRSAARAHKKVWGWFARARARGAACANHHHHPPCWLWPSSLWVLCG